MSGRFYAHLTTTGLKYSSLVHKDGYGVFSTGLVLAYSERFNANNVIFLSCQVFLHLVKTFSTVGEKIVAIMKHKANHHVH